MFKDFKEFAMKGNVVDLAIGIVIGAAFGKIVTSFVTDILMPPIGLILGKVDFSNLYINLSGTAYTSLAEAKRAGAPTVNYGLFLNAVTDFLIVAFVVFMLVKLLKKIKNDKPVDLTTRICPECLSAIPVAAKKCAFCTSSVTAS